MHLRGNAAQVLTMLATPGSIKAFLGWPKFSITSYAMVYDLRRQGVVPNTIIDVGANVGQFAVAAAKLFPSAFVHSFEPVPECVGELKQNVSSLPHVRVYPFALGDRDGEVLFNVNTDSRSSSVLPLGRLHREHFPGVTESTKLSVKLTTLDLALEQTSLRPPVLLKLDVQGFEAEVLRGSKGTLSKVDCVILEASFKPMYEGETTFLDVCKLMETFGFHFSRPVGWLASPETGEILQVDAFFVRRK